MFEKLQKLWKLIKKKLTKPQKQVFAEKIKKHKSKLSKIEKEKKAFLNKILQKKKQQGSDFKATQADRERVSKFNQKLRKESLSIEKTSRKLTAAVLENEQKRVDKLKKMSATAKESAEKFKPILLNLKEKRAQYKAKLEKIQADKEAFRKVIRQRKKEDATILTSVDKTRYKSFLIQEKLLQKQIANTENLMRVNLRERKRYTNFTKEMDAHVTKLEKGMKMYEKLAEAPIRYRESSEKLAKASKASKLAIDSAIKNSMRRNDGLKFTEAEKENIAKLKQQEQILQTAHKKSQKLMELNKKYHAKRQKLSSLTPSSTPKKGTGGKGRGL